MIALVRGELVERGADHVVVLCGGVGYRLGVSAQTLGGLPGAGREVTVHTHLIVRDDALALYGFASVAERDLFLMLLGVQAVGPKMALAVLSGGSPGELLTAIAAGDARRFQAVPGIGKRTAERIIVELREKVAGDMEIVAARIAGGEPRALAREGLVELGFPLPEAERLLADADGDTAEQLIATALRSARALS
jgi:Holliday junction DNA helicase RuvA